MNLSNMHYAMALMELLYGITMLEDAWEEIALIAFNLIGNKRVKTYHYVACPNNNAIELPCNCDILEAVTTNWEDWNHVTNTTSNGDLSSLETEHYIESRKAFHDHLYANGKFVKYERVGNTLYFSEPFGLIHVLYRGLILDEDGLPEITDKEALAIATYCAYIHKYKEGLSTNNFQIITLANTLYLKWQIQCDQARVSDYLNQNELDEILDAKTSWTRKQFRKSFKIYN